MTWAETKKFVRGCVENWKTLTLKSQFNGKDREILEKTYLVLDYSDGQIELSGLTLDNIALNHQGLLAKTYANASFIRLVKKKIELNQQMNKTRKILEWTIKQIKNANTELLELNPFTVEVRFKQLNFDLIQRLKYSEHCDRQNTEMGRISIKVALKGKKPE
ncbi:MAG: hypothetical protein ABH844_03010 [Candidatus Omnitrophota bacterium]